MSVIFSNNLKFQKSHLHQWKPVNNGPVLLKITLLRGTKRLVSVNISSVEGNSAGIFVNKVSPGILVIKVK